MAQGNEFRFQVDLRGVIDLLSHHLYSGPKVFIRELLQNATDAIQARRQIEPSFTGAIQLECIHRQGSPPTLIVQDDGIGLNEEEIHTFLATVGQSSKRDGFATRREEFLGQFGIGLLSSFMVSEEIVVVTRSAKPGSHPTLEWRGKSDGTYSVRVLDAETPVGTQVYLRAAATAEELFEPETLRGLARHYAGFLRPTIQWSAGGAIEQINHEPIWEIDLSDPSDKERALLFGKEMFEQEFLDVVSIRSVAGDVVGLAYILATPARTGVKLPHRVYLKNMLLTAGTADLLPAWACFAQCILNATALRPTASRESFQEDATLEQAREELGRSLRSYLVAMGRTEPHRLRKLISVHDLPLKQLAAEDDECLELFADWFSFETSLGTMTLGEFLRENEVVRYVPTRDQFRQIAPVAAAEAVPVVNAGYVFEQEILQRLPNVRPNLSVQPFEIEELADRFEPLSLDEREETIEFERFADLVLQAMKCRVELVRFRPTLLPALYVVNEDGMFLRSLEQSREVADELWRGVLDNFSQEVAPRSYSRLFLNYDNDLVRQIVVLADRSGQQRCIEMLYIQALLLGHFPLGPKESRLLNDGLSGILQWALKTRKELEQ